MRRLFTLVLLLSFHSLWGQVLLKPPLGRQWGEAPAELLQWAGKARLDVFVELPAAEPDLQIFTFQEKGGGIPGGSGAHSIEARFYKNRLYELTVNFEFADKDADQVRAHFHARKEKFEKEMGEFRLNGRAQSADNSFLTREESFHYEPVPKVFLLMAYSSVQDLLRKEGEGRYSVIYHNGREGPP